MKLWDAIAGKELHALSNRGSAVRAVALTPDGKLAISATEDGRLQAWSLEDGTCLATFTGEAPFRSCAIARNLALIAGDTAGQVHFFRLML